MKFTDLFIKRPVLSICISLLIVILGLQAIFKLPVREYPEMTTTVVTVSVNYAGADANVMQAFVTSMLEESIAQADNIDYMTSASRPSSSTITVKMKLNTDPDSALSDISAQVNAVRAKLPKGIDDPSISVSSGAMNAILFISFRSQALISPQVTDYIERVVKPQIFTVDGVSKVNIFGGSSFALRIWLDPQKMAGYNLSAPMVANALASNNLQTAAGNANGYFTVYKNRVESTTRSVGELENLVIQTTQDGQQIKLKDIATVELDKSSDVARATANGSDTVIMAIESASTANPLTVAKDIYPLFEKIQASFPPSITAEIIYDKTTAINNAIAEVIKTILEATVIVLVVITLFLGSLRAMIIPVLTIPISLIGVIMLLQAFGFSINLMTLLALILAIGLVVDDAIVVLENVDRHVKEGLSPFNAAIIGTREIAVPVIAMTITLCAVYAPMALMSGVTGSLFKEFALTLAGAVFISGIIALTLSPMMSSRILQENSEPSKLEKCVEGFLHRITACYTNLLTLVMASRKFILVFALMIFTTLPFLFNALSSEVAPSEDRGAVMGVATAPSNTNLDYVQEVLKPFMDQVKEIPEVHFSQMIAGIPSSSGAFLIISLKDWADRQRSQAQVLAQVNNLAKSTAEASISAFAFPEISTGESGLPFSFVITTADDYRGLSQVAQDFLLAAQKSGQFFFNSLDLKFDTATMRIKVDRDKLGAYGITMQQLSSTLGSFLSGAIMTRVDIDSRSYPIISQVERKDRLNPQDLNNYYVNASNGQAVPLGALISMELETQPASLNRFNQLNSATISGVVSGSIGDAVKWAETFAAEHLPTGYKYDFLSESRQYIQEGNALALTFLLAVIMIYLVLAIQFESWRDPMVILVSVPLAVSGALLVLNILSLPFFAKAGSTLNIYSQVGLITLVGLITKHGILMCEVAKEEQLHRGLSRIEAITYAAKIRLRPILMTTAAMIAGLIPLLFATGAGAVSRFSIGVVIIAGLAIGTLFTLFVLPVIYSFLASEHKPLKEFEE